MGSSPLEPGTVVAGRYRVEGEIGKGGMGVVYLVRHVHTDESLALKILHTHHLREPQAVERFKREARAPARIASEHVARVTDADTANELEGQPFYVVMELLRGKDLEQILREQGRLAPEVAVEYLRQAARALDKAHAIGIVHRDLKPENLFLTQREDGSPCIKLLDFGIARLADAEAPPGGIQTQAGFVFGTPTFMAPEQAMGSIELIGPATDVWALGLVAFKLLVGHEFWDAKTVAQLYAKLLSEPIPLASQRGSQLGPAFDEWFARAVNRTIEARFTSAGEAVAALGAALGVRVASRSSVSLVASSELEGDAARAVRSLREGSVPSATRLGIGDVAGTPAAAPARVPSAPAFVQPTSSDPFGADVPALPIDQPAWRRPLPIAIAVVTMLIVAGSLTFGYRLAKGRGSVGLVASASSVSVVSDDAGANDVPPPPPSTVAAADSTPAAKAAAPSAVADGPRPRLPKATASPAKTAGGEAPPAATGPAPSKELSRDQRRRLEALQRLCDQGTFTPAECSQKRNAIMHEGR